MSGFTVAIVIVVVLAVALFVWAARGDKTKSSLISHQDVEAAQRARLAQLGVDGTDYRLVKAAARYGLQLDLPRDLVAATGQASGPFTRSLARVESHGQLSSRITATRIAAFGVFALAARKKVDQRELYLTVEGDGFQILLQVDPDLGAAARKFAAAYNTRSGTLVHDSASAAVQSEDQLG